MEIMENSGKERKKEGGKSNGITTMNKLGLIFSPEPHCNCYKQEKQSWEDTRYSIIRKNIK